MYDLEYWTDVAIRAMRTQGYTKPTALYLVTQSDEFKNSGISEEDLSNAISQELEKEKQVRNRSKK
jgi:hypothetical protein